MARKKLRIYFTLAGFLLGVSVGVSASEKDAELYKLQKIAKITITNPTERSDYNPEETCESFVMTQKLAKDFFRHAKVTSANYHHYRDDLSSCSSEGSVEFSNGDKGHWTISRNGVGLMSILNREELKSDVIYLHCDKCENWNL